MTLHSDVNSHIKYDMKTEQFNPYEAELAVKGRLVEDELWDDSHRWYVFYRAVFSRDDQFVAVVYPTPATFYQEVDKSSIECYPVYPEEVTKVVYRKVRQ